MSGAPWPGGCYEQDTAGVVLPSSDSRGPGLFDQRGHSRLVRASPTDGGATGEEKCRPYDEIVGLSGSACRADGAASLWRNLPPQKEVAASQDLRVGCGSN
jgi:hypothetical protein